MPETKGRRNRTYNAENAREAIIKAAATIFAEHGFDGTRMDTIAAASGYNKSLLFQYFGSKLNLYIEVLKRFDREIHNLQAQVLTSLIEDDHIVDNPHVLKAHLETAIGTLFDYLIAHPQIIRLLLWEMAEGWQTYIKISELFQPEIIEQYNQFFSKVEKAGLLRSNFAPAIQLIQTMQICLSYLASLSLYQRLIPRNKDTYTNSLTQVRTYIIAAVVAGIIIDPPAHTPALV